jgi:hypothetical protein
MAFAQTLWVGTRKGLFVAQRGDAGWRIGKPRFPGEPVSQFLANPHDGAWYAALRLGHFGVKLWKSSDGDQWNEIAAPAFPPKPTEGPWKDDATPWTVDQVWALEAFPDGRLWAGGLPAGLFASRDGGASWTNTSAGMVADFLPPERREDPNIQDAHRIDQCLAQPDVLWCQHHGGLYRSTNAGLTWEAIAAPQPSGFGFAVAADPRDPQRAWFVPAHSDAQRIPADGRLVVNETRDGGGSFVSHGEGLPQHDAYHLIYRHALVASPDGRTLAIGSTTGGLWISEDAGVSWQCLSRDLPPIAVLRIGGGGV